MNRRPWRAKAFLQQGFSHVPGGHRLNYVFQRHVTHGLPLPDADFDAQLEIAKVHLRAAQEHVGDPAALSFYEFGAGWDLMVPLALHALGAGHQTVVDIRPLARLDLVLDAAARLELRLGSASAPTAASLAELLGPLGIDYRAPCDARGTDLGDGTVDVITSTNTLEHIPADDIRAILRENRRILRDSGVMSFQIDYQDHYSYFDDSLSVYHFLAYDERTWRRYNPSLHYQNRLRHADHLRLIDEAGFDVVHCVTEGPDEADLRELARVPLAAEFAGRPPRELGVRSARLVLRKRTRSDRPV